MKNTKAKRRRAAAGRLNRRQLREFRKQQTSWGGANEPHDATASLPKAEAVS
jgi:hypothetical protein